MKKNKYIVPILFILCFFTFNMKGKAVYISGLGDGNVSPGSSSYCNDTQGCVHNEKGVRVTLVDKNGKQVAGTQTVDYWNTLPGGSPEALSGSTYKSKYINSYGKISSSFSSYTIKTSTNTSSIGGISWTNQHELIENIIENDLKQATGDTSKCVNSQLFNDLGYNICNDIQKKPEECQKLLWDKYILIEPLFHINIKKHDVIVTGTEFTYLVHIQRQIDSNRVYNLSGDAGYGSALVGMYITRLNSDDDTDYAFNANGKKYVRLTQKTAERYSDYADWVHTAAYGAGSENYPYGSSMHLVWLGDNTEDLCGPPNECCIPCSVANVEGCDPDDCCYEEDGEISTDGTTDACVPWEQYWNNSDEAHNYELVCTPCCIPTPSNDYCCEDTGAPICDGSERKSYREYWSERGDYDEVCGEKNECPVKDLEPEVIVNYCDDDNNNNTSYFRDGVFNSSGGQFAGYTIEKMEESIVDAVLPITWVNKMANEYMDNSFLALAYLNDSRYSTKINDYCNIHCQEVFEVDLPDNYPYVEAGRYFKWTIKDSENDIAKAAGAKLCAVDIDLDKAIDNYQQYSIAAKEAAEGLANLTCNNKWGVKPVTDGEFATCDAYANEYENYCAPTYVCLSYAQSGECPIYCTKSVTDANGKSHSVTYVCGHEPKYVCTQALTGKAAQHWYAFVGGTHYNPGCGSPGEAFTISALDNCKNKLAVYEANVENYNTKTEKVYKQIKECKASGELLLDMNLELEYQTLFGEHTYSTPADIEKIPSDGAFGENQTCVDNTDECNSEDIFTMSKRDDKISCVNQHIEWVPDETEDYNGVCGPGKVKPVDPNIDLGNYYEASSVKMLNVNKFSRCSGFLEAGPRFDFSKDKDWNTIYASYISTSDLYQLNEMINACICKDGEVLDSEEDGSCSCVREVSYKGFIETYNNYQKLPDGTLTVEFMNGSGLYPIGLKYWTLGSVDENGNGHFDTIVDDLGIAECAGGECIYGDPYGVCRFVVKNRIIASPDDDDDFDDDDDDDDDGECINPPCDDDDDDDGICVDPPCDDDDDDDDIGDYGECIVDGKPVPECGDVAGLNVIYRVIDLDNPFPGANGTSRKPGKNWSGKESVITENRGTNGMGVYSLEPLYSVTLTPATIKEIRKDNHNDMNGDYLKGTLIYPSNSPGVYGGGYSLFLHEELENIAVGSGGDFSIKITNDDRFSDILKTR